MRGWYRGAGRAAFYQEGSRAGNLLATLCNLGEAREVEGFAISMALDGGGRTPRVNNLAMWAGNGDGSSVGPLVGVLPGIQGHLNLRIILDGLGIVQK